MSKYVLARKPGWAAVASVGCLWALCGSSTVAGSSLPAGFEENLLAQGLDSPTAVDVLPDGLILVAEQGGVLRKIPAGGGAASTLYAFSSVNSQGERGLLGVVVDPHFGDNGFVYVYYTTNAGGLHNRVSRLHLENGQVIGGESVVFDFPVFSGAIWHMGGAMRFALDGTLFVGVGDHRMSQAAQNRQFAFGKVHRIAADGSIPPDNPFVHTGGGVLPSIYTYGLRNPYSLDVDPDSGELLINDVGESTWEEVNLGAPGANYGWPNSEGPDVGAGQTAPIYAYRHAQGACAITGGVAYPTGGTFPESFWGKYLFIDFCAGWIHELDRVSGTVATFATGLDFPTALRLDPQGRLLYLTRGSEGGGGEGAGRLHRIRFTLDPSLLPQIVEQPGDVLAGEGETASFEVVATRATAYRWQRNGADIPDANLSVLHVENVSAAEDGARFRALVSNSYGTVASTEAVLTVTPNHAPTATIDAPLAGSGYEPGATLAFSGSASDPEEGELPPAALTWRIDLHHDAHVHPLMPPTSGVAAGTFVLPPEADHADGLVWLEVVLIATDAEGRSGASSAHIFPVATLAGASPHVLALRGGEYLVSLEFQNPLTGLPETALAWPQSSDSGGFWFFHPDNLEVLLKVLDGTGTNGCQWIFFGALSTVEFDFFVVEARTGRLRSYSSPFGSQASFGDIETFCGGVAPGAPEPASAITAEAPRTSNLDLLGGRFRLTVEWSSPWNGDVGVGEAVPLTDQSGMFTFFDPANLEMAVKMVDGTDYNNHFWVFWTALSNLETVLTVEDLFTSRIRSFPKPGLSFGAGADIGAFPAD